jgi:hypothetical protein
VAIYEAQPTPCLSIGLLPGLRVWTSLPYILMCDLSLDACRLQLWNLVYSAGVCFLLGNVVVNNGSCSFSKLKPLELLCKLESPSCAKYKPELLELLSGLTIWTMTQSKLPCGRRSRAQILFSHCPILLRQLKSQLPPMTISMQLLPSLSTLLDEVSVAQINLHLRQRPFQPQKLQSWILESKSLYRM